MKVYLDNAATSRFKPASAIEAALYDIKHSANSGRSGHSDALAASFRLEECRKLLLYELGGADTHCAIFTKSCTEALNLALFGIIKGGEKVLTTANEHNAVLRPLYELKARGMISLSVIGQENDGRISLSKIAEAAKYHDIAVLGGCCNVTGASLDIAEAARAIKKNRCMLIVDGAQCVPLQDIDVAEMGIDMLACPGHKGLHGLQGTGFLIADKTLKLRPLIYGGTGTFSAELMQPDNMPEGLEAGTQPAGAIAALKEGAKWSFEHKTATRGLYAQLTKTALYNLKNIGCRVFCENCDSGIIAFNVSDADSAYVAGMLDDEGIAVRSGLHCAPLVHRFFGTLEQGMVRVSFGVDNTMRDVLYLSDVMQRIATKIL